MILPILTGQERITANVDTYWEETVQKAEMAEMTQR